MKSVILVIALGIAIGVTPSNTYRVSDDTKMPICDEPHLHEDEEARLLRLLKDPIRVYP